MNEVPSKEPVGMADDAVSPNRRVPRYRLAAAAAACVVLLPIAACTGQNHESAAMNAIAASSTDAPVRKLNPDAQRAYQIRVVLSSPPGPFASVSGVAQYNVSNAGKCAKGDPIVGNVPVLTENVPFELSKVSETEYTGVIYQDRLQDEDYHGHGACHWELNEARVVLRATGDDADARFVSGIPSEEVDAEGSRVRYFWSGYYPRSDMENFPVYGQKDLESVPEDKRDEFFTVTMTAQAVTP